MATYRMHAVLSAQDEATEQRTIFLLSPFLLFSNSTEDFHVFSRNLRQYLVMYRLEQVHVTSPDLQ